MGSDLAAALREATQALQAARHAEQMGCWQAVKDCVHTAMKAGTQAYLAADELEKEVK